jgi:hypothetical protein
MSAFTKENLVRSGHYVHYSPSGNSYSPDAVFVARFKHARGSVGPFMTFLRKNFTVEEYFARRDAGESPLPIVKSKGFILSHIKSWLRKDGFAVTPEGYEQWTAAQAAKRASKEMS